jgi:hypothetical protein
MTEPLVVAETFATSDPERAIRSPIPEMASVSSHVGSISTDEAEDWLAQLAEAATRRNFFWAVTMFAVGATRPERLTTHAPPPRDARNVLLKSQVLVGWRFVAARGIRRHLMAGAADSNDT